MALNAYYGKRKVLIVGIDGTTIDPLSYLEY